MNVHIESISCGTDFLAHFTFKVAFKMLGFNMIFDVIGISGPIVT